MTSVIYILVLIDCLMLTVWKLKRKKKSNIQISNKEFHSYLVTNNLQSCPIDEVIQTYKKLNIKLKFALKSRQ